MGYHDFEPWEGVDFDGTLATYKGYSPDGANLGDPIMPMVGVVKSLLQQGKKVKIMTARVAPHKINFHIPSGGPVWDVEMHRKAIEDWCEQHIGQRLEVTHEKNFEMVRLWDDRAITVEKDAGTILTPLDYMFKIGTPALYNKDEYNEVK